MDRAVTAAANAAGAAAVTAQVRLAAQVCFAVGVGRIVQAGDASAVSAIATVGGTKGGVQTAGRGKNCGDRRRLSRQGIDFASAAGLQEERLLLGDAALQAGDRVGLQLPRVLYRIALPDLKARSGVAGLGLHANACDEGL